MINHPENLTLGEILELDSKLRKSTMKEAIDHLKAFRIKHGFNEQQVMMIGKALASSIDERLLSKLRAITKRE